MLNTVKKIAAWFRLIKIFKSLNNKPLTIISWSIGNITNNEKSTIKVFLIGEREDLSSINPNIKKIV